jgi:tellurite resistance protein TehA-like permease
MMKIMFNFFMLALSFGLGISAFRRLSGKEQWNLTKLVAYSLFCAILAIVLLATIVVLF